MNLEVFEGKTREDAKQKAIDALNALAQLVADGMISEATYAKSIDELKGYGLRVSPAKKGKDSVLNGIQWIQDLPIIVHPRCVNFLTEIGSYIWKDDKFGKRLNEPIDDSNHLMDAMRYALEKHIKGKGWLI